MIIRKLKKHMTWHFFITCIIVGFGICTLSSTASFAKTTGFTIDQILSAPLPSSLHAAHSGSQVAWVFSDRGIKNTWIAGPTDTGFKSRKLTNFTEDDGQELDICGFSYDDKYIIFTKGSRFNPSHDPGGVPFFIIYQVEIATGKMVVIARTGSDRISVSPTSPLIALVKNGDLYIITPSLKESPPKALSLQGELSKPSWSPDGKKLLMSCDRGKPPHRYSFIVLFDLEKKEVQYVDASVYLDGKPCWSPDGKQFAFMRRLCHGFPGILSGETFPVPDPWEIRVAATGTTGSKPVWRSPATDTVENAKMAWLDNQHLVFTSEADNWAHLYTVPANGKSNQARQISKGNFEVENFIVTPSLGKVFFTSNEKDINRRHIWTCDNRGPRTAVTYTTGTKTIEWNPVITGDKHYMAYFSSSALEPAQVFIRPLDQQKAKKNPIQLAPGTMPGDFPKSLVVPQEVVFDSIDGWKIHGQLFLPPQGFKGKRPALIYFHGGPVRQMLPAFHYNRYYHYCYAMNQYLASRGYVVLAVNYRLGIGYGRAFRDVPDGGPRGCSEYRDLLAGAKFLRNRDDVDAKRMGLWGGSYGGLMTALGLARNSDLFAAGVDLHGVHDWNQWQAWSENQPNDNNRITWKSSPIADVSSWRSPVLLVHGDDDRDVPFSETIWLAQKLREQKVDCEVLILPGEVHGFLLHHSWVKVFKAAADFFDRKL